MPEIAGMTDLKIMMRQWPVEESGWASMIKIDFLPGIL
jgi:hypothetical protein